MVVVGRFWGFCAVFAAAALGLGLMGDAPSSRRDALVEWVAVANASPARTVVRVPAGAREPSFVVRLAPDAQDAIDETVRTAIAAGDYPGCVIAVGRRDGLVFRRAYGTAREDTIYDLASLTKPVVTATSIALLVDAGRLSLDDRVARHLPELARSEHAGVTLRQLLGHNAGLPAILPLAAFEGGSRAALSAIARSRSRSIPGDAVHYSDVGFVLLGAVVERVSAQSLDSLVRERVFAPLGMRDSGFRPLAAGIDAARIAPTELRDDVWLRGHVHDPRAAALGGVAGHAGLFSSVGDLARFARMLLARGRLGDVRILSERTVAELTRGVDVNGDRRALGWDVADDVHPGNLGRRAFGHGGFTGTSLWIDPELDLFVIVLSNRLHPDGKGAVQPTAERVQALAAEAARRRSIAPALPAPVLTGIDVLGRDGFGAIAGKRIGLISNASARARDGRTTAEVLARAPGVRLVALFSPEHGVEATAHGAVSDGEDPRTGLPVRSLYGAALRPSAAALSDLDTLVFDVQDVGARFYTYLSTLRAAMIVGSELGKGFVVLDRPNPLGGTTIEGPSIDAGRRSFVNHHPLPVRHGLTAGEMALLLAAELELASTPEVVRIEGWSRAAHWPDTGLPWVRPSPNLPEYDSALLYPGVALLELTNVSVGRGTDAPFSRVGAPWIDGKRLARALSERGLGAVTFSPDRFVPQSSVHAGKVCSGVRIRVLDSRRARPVTIGLAIATELARLHGQEWQPEGMDVLLAHRATRAAVLRGASPGELERSFEAELAAFRARRAPHLLY